jgi:hypothetical protein
MERLKKSRKRNSNVRFSMVDADVLEKNESGFASLEKSVMTTLSDLQAGKQVHRLAFEEDPIAKQWRGLWKPKPPHLVPDAVLKRIAVRDDLIAAVLNARAGHVKAFGRELQDRFSTGFRLEPRKGIMEKASKEEKAALLKAISETSKLLSSCGRTEGVGADERLSFAGYLYQQARNAVLFGRFATEVVHCRDYDGKRIFHSFRPVDAGTVYQTVPRDTDGLANVRESALKLLEDLKNERLKPEMFARDEYAWVQVIDEHPRQAFTAEELLVANVYPVTDIESLGYPLTPLDTAIDAITTHMSITAHNRLYFQSGRAARGMIVIKSTDISQDIVQQIRQHFNASINSVQNSWRVPVFGIDPEEDVSWEPLELQGGRDQEFQYLADSNARVILSAFQMSPEELPGYAHLSRGSNNQALSESNNEYKLEAARDVGIRPLLASVQDFVNERILPLINPTVARLCVLKLYGLDADTAEKEAQRIVTDQSLHMTYDEIRNRVEKDPIGVEWGGEYPLSPAIQGVHDKYLPVGKIVEHFFGIEGASKDPALQYIRCPFWFNYQQLLLQQQQIAQQQQQAEQQAQAEQMEQKKLAEKAESNGKDEGGGEQPEENDISNGADQAMQLMSKSEEKLPPAKRRVFAQHRATVKNIMDEWEKESQAMLNEVLAQTAAKVKRKS